MHKPYDTTLKLILDDFGADWFAWLARRYGYPPGPVKTLNPEIDTVQIAADKVFRFAHDAGILHLEVQSSWDGELPDRMLEYNVFLHRRERLPVHSVVILLRRDANAQAVTGTLVRRRRGGQLVLQFEYDVIRVWELSANELLSGDLGVAPLGLLTDDAGPQLPQLVKRFASRVEREVPSVSQQSQFLASSSILMGLRYNSSQIQQLFLGVQAMKESSVYQALIAEGEAIGEAKGRVEGEAKGRVEGEAKGYRLALIALIEQKFGSIPADVESRIHATIDPAKLQNAIRQVLTISAPNDLML